MLTLPILLSAALAQDAYLDAKALRSLDLPRSRAGVPTSYSRGLRDRARDLGGSAGDALAFYDRELGIERDIRLAVLDAADWGRVSPLPYGLPFVDGGVAVIPAGGGILAADFAALPLDPVRQQILAEEAGSVDAAIGLFVDVIAFHEIGHELTAAYGIAPPTRWLTEFTATYFAYAFLHAERPGHARVFDELSQAKIEAHRPAHSTLAELEALYVGVGVSDYAWYQCHFERQVRAIYDLHGLAFLAELKRAFPADTPVLPEEEILARLDAAAPGMRAWAEGFPPAP